MRKLKKWLRRDGAKAVMTIALLALCFAPYLGTGTALAVDLDAYDNLTVTRTLTFANVLTGSMYDQVEGVIPFVIQVAVVLIIIALVFGIPYLIWRGVRRFTGGAAS